VQLISDSAVVRTSTGLTRSDATFASADVVDCCLNCATVGALSTHISSSINSLELSIE